jgi:hypothetical protein
VFGFLRHWCHMWVERLFYLSDLGRLNYEEKNSNSQII